MLLMMMAFPLLLPKRTADGVVSCSSEKLPSFHYLFIWVYLYFIVVLIHFRSVVTFWLRYSAHL